LSETEIREALRRYDEHRAAKNQRKQLLDEYIGIPRRSSRFSNRPTFNPETALGVQDPGLNRGLGGFLEQDPVSAAKGLGIALPAAAPDIVGLAQQGLQAGGKFIKDSFLPGLPDVHMGTLSGDPLRESIDLDPDNPQGLVGEVASPVGTLLKGLAATAKAIVPALSFIRKSKLLSDTPELSKVAIKLKNPDTGKLIPAGAVEHDPSLVSVKKTSDEFGDVLNVEPTAGYSQSIKEIAPPQEGVIYRGISSDEYRAIGETGVIKSNGAGNQSSQAGQTIYSPESGVAEQYAIPKGFDDSAYVVAVKDPGTGLPNGPLTGTETAIPGSIPAEDIVGIYEKKPATISDTGQMGFVYKNIYRDGDITPADLNRAQFTYNDSIPAAKANSVKVAEVARPLQADALKAWGGEPMPVTEENLAQVADGWTEEALKSFELRPEMAGWYKRNLDEALSHASRIYPELATDQEALDGFKVILAITSNGQPVHLNSVLTNKYYQLYRKTGEFPLLGNGDRKQAMVESFGRANELFQRLGHDGAMDFLNRDFRVKELQDLGFQINELVTDTVKGSRIFGPKIGGGFMQNLFGNFDPATVDMWAKRTYGRYSGTLLARPELIDAQRKTLRAAIGRKKKFITDLGFDPEVVARDDDVLDQLAETLHKQFAKSVDPQTGSGTYFDKNPINNAARQLDKSNNKVRDQVSAPEARVIRELMVMTRDRLRQRGLTNIDTADVQALLWYAEKDLYAKYGGKVDTNTSDYATTWKNIADTVEKHKK